MSVSKMDIFDKLIEGYVKAPPSFQEQAITTLAIQLCQNVELQKGIIYEKEPLRYKDTSWSKWEKFIEERSSNMCQKLPLPPVLKNKMISGIRIIALQLYNWNRKQDMFNLSSLNLNTCLNTSDWTVVKMRLDEKQIAKRLVLDERIPVCQRFRMACFYCIEDMIHPLWSQISRERRIDIIFHEELKVAQLWCLHLEGFFQELIPRNYRLSHDLLRAGVLDGSMSGVLECWDKLHINERQGVLKDTIMTILHRFNSRSWKSDTDIFCFLLMQMSKEQRRELFQEIFQNYEINPLAFFIQWPYLELLIPIIKELWNILSQEKYRELLLTLVDHHCNYIFSFIGRKDYMDYEYGNVIIQLLEETPEHFKRYVFGNNFQQNTFLEVELFYIITNEGDHKIHYRKVFKQIWKHVTPEEKNLFLRSYYNEKFCRNLATQYSWEQFNSILRECLSEGEISMYRNAILDVII